MFRVTTNCIRADHDAPLNKFARRFGPLLKVDRVLGGKNLVSSTKVDCRQTKVDRRQTKVDNKS